MIATLADILGLSCLGIALAADSEGGRASRALLTLMKLAPVAALTFTLGAAGIGLIAGLSGLLALGLSRLTAASGGRAHLVTGLCAGALFASGPFGAVVTGGALAASALTARRATRAVAALDIALVLFVPLVVVLGFAVAAAAQTGDPFALTAPHRTSLSPLSAWLPRWPAAWTALGLLAVPGFSIALAPGSARRPAALALLGGAAATLVTFGDTIDGIAEGAIVIGCLAGILPHARLTARSAMLIAMQGAAVIALCVTVMPAAPGVPRPPYPMWRIAPPALDALPPWGIDHAR